MVDCTLKTFGNIDVLVNCAGCMYYQLMKNGGKEVFIFQMLSL